MTRSFVDYHSHLLPAVDDGAVDLSDSLDMARVLSDFGYATVHCTPHFIKGGFDNPPARVKQGVRSLQQMILDAGIPLHLAVGTEHYLDEYLPERLPEALTVAGSRYLLVEAPFRAGPELIPGMVAELRRHRLFPLFAHPERCHAFAPPPREEGMRGALSFIFGRRKAPGLEDALVLRLKESGCRFQGNIGSFAGVYGSVVKQRAVQFLKHGVYSCLGSDAHTAQGLAAILNAGLETLVANVGEEGAYRLLEGRDFTPEP